MMRAVISSLILVTIVLSLACTRVRLEIGQGATPPSRGTESPTPDPAKEIGPRGIPEMDPSRRGGPGAALRPDFIVLTQYHAEDNACATDRHETQAIAQETGVWCWAASAQAVMSFHNAPIEQCTIVNKVANEGKRTDEGTPFCCKSTNIYQSECQKNGLPEQAFNNFGFDWRWWNGPLQQEQVAGQICSNGPFIYILWYEGGGGHSLVVRDYQMINGEMWLWIHDHSYMVDNETGRRTPKPFKLRPYKEYAEGMYEGVQYTHAFDYVLINPLQ